MLVFPKNAEKNASIIEKDLQTSRAVRLSRRLCLGLRKVKTTLSRGT